MTNLQVASWQYGPEYGDAQDNAVTVFAELIDEAYLRVFARLGNMESLIAVLGEAKATIVARCNLLYAKTCWGTQTNDNRKEYWKQIAEIVVT